MAFHVRDPETDRLVRKLARSKRIGLTAAIRLAVNEELARTEPDQPLRQRLRAIAREIAAYPDTGLKAGKQFFDDLSGT